MAAIARLGKRLGRGFDSQPAGQNVATHLYDALGRRTTMVDFGAYSFDALGRQSGQTDAAGFVHAYTHDETGNRTGLNLVGTGRFTFTFDSLNRLATAQKPGDQLYTLSYDADSRRTTMMLGAGSTRQYQFDARSQLTTQIELSGATPICTIVDGYDPVGNRVTRNLDGVPVTWSYDDLYRLTGQLKAGQVCTYSLDGVGNLKTMWEGGNFPKTFAFDAADRLSTMTEGANLTTYSWTKFGALASEITGAQITTNAYNGQDQLVGVTPPSGFPSTYSFDGNGLRRTAQEGNALPTTMVWDGSDYLLLRGPSSDQVVLSLDSEIVAAGDKDLLTDPLGTLVKEITAGAHLSGLFQFTPYGALAGPNPLTVNPYRYGAAHGYYTDNTHRDYIRARELEKKLGRWMQLDPLWPGEMPYAYAGDSPASLQDASGLSIVIPFPVVAGGGLSLGAGAVGIGILAGAYLCARIIEELPKQQRTCDDETFYRLYTLKKSFCEAGNSCKKIPKIHASCPRICANIWAATICLKLRHEITELCYGGAPEPGHDKQEVDVANGIARCRGLATELNCQCVPIGEGTLPGGGIWVIGAGGKVIRAPRRPPRRMGVR